MAAIPSDTPPAEAGQPQPQSPAAPPNATPHVPQAAPAPPPPTPSLAPAPAPASQPRKRGRPRKENAAPKATNARTAPYPRQRPTSRTINARAAPYPSQYPIRNPISPNDPGVVPFCRPRPIPAARRHYINTMGPTPVDARSAYHPSVQSQQFPAPGAQRMFQQPGLPSSGNQWNYPQVRPDAQMGGHQQVPYYHQGRNQGLWLDDGAALRIAGLDPSSRGQVFPQVFSGQGGQRRIVGPDGRSLQPPLPDGRRLVGPDGQTLPTGGQPIRQMFPVASSQGDRRIVGLAGQVLQQATTTVSRVFPLPDTQGSRMVVGPDGRALYPDGERVVAGPSRQGPQQATHGFSGSVQSQNGVMMVGNPTPHNIYRHCLYQQYHQRQQSTTRSQHDEYLYVELVPAGPLDNGLSRSIKHPATQEMRWPQGAVRAQQTGGPFETDPGPREDEPEDHAAAQAIYLAILEECVNFEYAE